MAFIYVITNDVNGKQYVGKTNKTIEQRFKEHTMECKRDHGHKVAMIDLKTDNVLRVFSNVSEAYHFLNKQQSGHISLVCNGKRKSAYGYKWKYSN